MADAERMGLIDVGYFKTPFGAVANGGFNSRAGFVDDYPKFLDTDLSNVFDRIEKQGFVGYGNQVFV